MAAKIKPTTETVPRAVTKATPEPTKPTKPTKPTMKDVAERAGVSIATVSFVVNNSKPVSAQTRRRIEDAMAELGFRPNILARALASRRTRIIALVFSQNEQGLGALPVDFAVSAAEAARDADYHLVIWPHPGDRDGLASLVGQGLVDGVLLMEVRMDDPRVESLRETGFPFALIGRTRDPAGLSCVDVDFDTSVRTAVEYLAGLGHDHIALVTGSSNVEDPDNYGPQARIRAAYRAVSAELELPTLMMQSRQTAVSGRTVARQLLASAPEVTAVLMSDNQAAPGLLAALQSAGVRVPQQISVLGLLTSTDLADICNPTLTVVGSPGSELGRLGVEALLRRLAGEAISAPELRAGRLVIGESTGPAPH